MTTFRSLFALSSLIAVSLASTACGEEAKDDASSTGGGAGEGNGGSDGGDTGGGAATGGNDGTGGSESACVRDTGEPSQSSTVEWNEDDPVGEGLTLTLGEVSIDPNELTVGVDVRFGIANPEGGGNRVIKVGCAEGQTIPATITAGFIIHAPGTYEIIDVEANDFAGVTIGTITVE